MVHKCSIKFSYFIVLYMLFKKKNFFNIQKKNIRCL